MSYTNSGLTAGRRCYYRVYAVNAAGRSADSNVADAVTGSTTTPTNPNPTPTTGAFKEQNGLVAMGVDSAAIAGGWVKETSMGGYSGSGYHTWPGPTQFNTPGQGVLTYQVAITNPGKYNFCIHNRHDPPSPPPRTTSSSASTAGRGPRPFPTSAASGPGRPTSTTATATSPRPATT